MVYFHAFLKGKLKVSQKTKNGDQTMGFFEKFKKYHISSLVIGICIAVLIIPVQPASAFDIISSQQTNLSPGLTIATSIFKMIFEKSSAYSKGALGGIYESGKSATLLSQSTRTIKGYERVLYLSEDYEGRIEQSARVFLPYTKILTAVNILLNHEKIGMIKKIKVDFEGHDDSAILKDGILRISFQAPEQLSTSEVLNVFTHDLGWDFTQAIKDLAIRSAHLLLDSNDFDAINIIIHERLAGLGDLVFVSNAGQVFSKIMPNKTIRVIFHSNADFQLVCSTKILKGLDPRKAIQKTGGIEIINAQSYGEEKLTKERPLFGVESQPWYKAQQEIIGENDVSIVYALEGTPKELMQASYMLKHYAGKAKMALFVHELGFSSLIRDPLASGEIHFGFGKDEVGMPPVSPVSEIIYAKKYPRINQNIQSERKRIIRKISGWKILDTVLKQENLERTIASEWGFLYAHRELSVGHYFQAFEKARKNNPDFREDTTFFMMCGRSDKAVIEKIQDIAKSYDYNLFIFNNSSEGLEVSHESKSNNVSIIMDYSVPRKLFNELFLYSDDLPTLVSGQDNLANILYLNLLTTGRPFFWEVLIFQATAASDMISFLRNKIGEAEADYFNSLLNNLKVSDDQAEMFSHPRKYRYFYKKVAQAFNEHKSFIAQVYYVMLLQTDKQSYAGRKRAQELMAQLHNLSVNNILDNKSPKITPISSVNKQTYVEQAI